MARVGHLIVSFAQIGYKFNFAKSHIAHFAVLFLGYGLNNEGRGLALHFLEKCAQLKNPTTLKKLQSLPGFLNFSRTYIPDNAQRIKPLYALIQPSFSKSNWLPEHSSILQSLQTDLLATNYLLTCDNHTNLVLSIVPGSVGFTYLTFNEGDTVPIAYKSHLYTAAEMRFSTTE